MFAPGDLDRAQDLARRRAGGRYIWGGCAPEGSDCSGFMSILLNSLEGRANVYVRRFSTGTLRDSADDLGLQAGLGRASTSFQLGVIYPWESSSGIGHVAGTLGGLNVESRGSYGVLVGARARSATSPLFRHHFHLEGLTMAEFNELKTQITGIPEQILSAFEDTARGKRILRQAVTTRPAPDEVSDDSAWSNTEAAQKAINDIRDQLTQTPPTPPT